MKKPKKEKKRKMPPTKTSKPPGAVKRMVKTPANSQGETVDLTELGLAERFNHGRSQYDVELDKLIADTKASSNPATVGRKYSDIRAQNSLKKRADLKNIRLEFLTLPNGQGFVVRIDPDPQPRSHRKTPTPAA